MGTALLVLACVDTVLGALIAWVLIRYVIERKDNSE